MDRHKIVDCISISQTRPDPLQRRWCDVLVPGHSFPSTSFPQTQNQAIRPPSACHDSHSSRPTMQTCQYPLRHCTLTAKICADHFSNPFPPAVIRKILSEHRSHAVINSLQCKICHTRKCGHYANKASEHMLQSQSTTSNDTESIGTAVGS